MSSAKESTLSDFPERDIAVLIPCLNEKKFIKRCLDSILADKTVRKRAIIYIIDGLSTDGTREIISEYIKTYPYIKLIDNPGANKSRGMNKVIKSCPEHIKFIIRVDAHSTYHNEYFTRSVEKAIAYNADNIGGALKVAMADSPISIAIGTVVSNPFAVGNAHHRINPTKPREVPTVFGGCYKKHVFDKIGLFNEKLLRAQDREFNLRLIKNGGKIMLDPSIKCTYYPRSTLKSYIKWNYIGAFWLFSARMFTDTPMLMRRNYIPLLFLIYHIITLFILFINPSSIATYIASIPIILYWTAVLALSAYHAFKYKKLGVLKYLFILFPATHYGYGIGSLHGLLYSALKKPRGNNEET